MTAHAIPLAELKAIARTDDRQRLSELLSTGVDPNRTDEVLKTPLAVVAKAGALACVRLLVEHGAALDAGDPPPVQAAIEAGRLEVLEELLKSGAESGGPEHYDPDYPAPLVIAAEVGDARAVEALLAADSLRRSPWAVVDEALREGLDLRGKKKLGVLRALALGLASNRIEIPPGAGTLLRALKFLAGAARKRGDSQLEEAVRELQTGLDEAKAEWDEAEAGYLESRFDELFELIERLPSARRPGVLGVVAVSSTTGCYCFAQWLLEKDAAANLCDETGKTALMHAAAHGSQYLVQPLLDTRHACLNARDDDGNTALDLLGSRPEFPFAHAIEGDLTYLYNARRDQGTPPARITEAPRVVRRARELMRDRRIPELLDLLNKGGLEEKERQLAAGAAVLEDSANDCMTLLEYCLDQGADLSARNDAGGTPLKGACQVYQTPLRLLRRMVEAGADPMAADRFGRSVADCVRKTWPKGHECRDYMESVLVGSVSDR